MVAYQISFQSLEPKINEVEVYGKDYTNKVEGAEGQLSLIEVENITGSELLDISKGSSAKMLAPLTTLQLSQRNRNSLIYCLGIWDMITSITIVLF